MAIHTVVAGDTLWKISTFYQVPLSTLMEVNGLNSDALVPGQNLYITDQSLPVRYYQIRPGDTLWSLSQLYGTTVQAILAANPGIDPYSLRVAQRIVIPSVLKYPMQSLIFFDSFDPAPYIETLREVAPNITYLAIFTYSFDREANLIEANDQAILQETKRNNIHPLLVVSNYEDHMFSPELGDRVLQNPALRQKLVNNIRAVVEKKGYAGVSIDFEFISPERRTDFTTFLRELKIAIGNRILQVNAHAKTSDNPTNRIVGFLDYQAIGQIVDIVSIMTIDYGYALGPPDPIAPVWWVEQVLQYATGQINRRKMMMAISLYGYDWTLPLQANRPAEMVAVNSLQNRALGHWAPIQYDSNAQAPGYTYTEGGNQHVVWFEDIRSVVAKYTQMEVYDLLGTTYWRLRFRFPQNWAYVQKNINVLK